MENKNQLKDLVERLSIISQPQNIRFDCSSNDLVGDYDMWFDGGAIKVNTGYTNYFFIDKVIATIFTTPDLRVCIEYPNGSMVIISQDKK